jgi:hypothetical protein
MRLSRVNSWSFDTGAKRRKNVAQDASPGRAELGDAMKFAKIIFRVAGIWAC